MSEFNMPMGASSNDPHFDVPSVGDDKEGVCYLCGREEWTDRAGYGFIVRDCDECERPVCEECAETDADCDQDGYFQTQWICDSLKGGCK